MKTILKVVVGLNVLVIALATTAQQTDGATWFAKQLGNRCRIDIVSTTKSLASELLWVDSSLDNERICSCVESRLLSDLKIQAHLKGSEAAAEIRIKENPFIAYGVLRITEAMSSCIAKEIDLSLTKFKLQN